VKPSTVDTGSSRPFSTDSSKLQRRLVEAMEAGAEADSNFCGRILEMSISVQKVFVPVTNRNFELGKVQSERI
jgi:hypothetical protein